MSRLIEALKTIGRKLLGCEVVVSVEVFRGSLLDILDPDEVYIEVGHGEVVAEAPLIASAKISPQPQTIDAETAERVASVLRRALEEIGEVVKVLRPRILAMIEVAHENLAPLSGAAAGRVSVAGIAGIGKIVVDAGSIVLDVPGGFPHALREGSRVEEVLRELARARPSTPVEAALITVARRFLERVLEARDPLIEELDSPRPIIAAEAINVGGRRLVVAATSSGRLVLSAIPVSVDVRIYLPERGRVVALAEPLQTEVSLWTQTLSEGAVAELIEKGLPIPQPRALEEACERLCRRFRSVMEAWLRASTEAAIAAARAAALIPETIEPLPEF